MPRLQVDEETKTIMEHTRISMELLHKKQGAPKKISNSEILKEALKEYAKNHNIPVPY
jgi:hypothetical protein